MAFIEPEEIGALTITLVCRLMIIQAYPICSLQFILGVVGHAGESSWTIQKMVLTIENFNFLACQFDVRVIITLTYSQTGMNCFLYFEIKQLIL